MPQRVITMDVFAAMRQREVPVIRLVKRYGSRKLYDTEESRYVSLDEMAGWIREGQQIKVVDNTTSEDVTAATLIQIISEQGRRNSSFLPKDVLHELIRRGEEVVQTGVGQLQSGVDLLLRASVDRIGPVKKIREETSRLRDRLDELETALAQVEARRRFDEEDQAPSGASGRSEDEEDESRSTASVAGSDKGEA